MKFKKKIKNISQKGFLGPIGDDLPSLIPIVVSLLLFFTIFSVTLNTYNSKNTLIRQQSSVINVAREMRGESLILNPEQFQERCSDIQAKNYGYNFMIGVYQSNDEGVTNAVQDFSETNVGPDNAYESTGGVDKFIIKDSQYFCGYKRPGSSQFASGAYTSQRKNSYSIRFYPVALQTKFGENYVIVPAILAMVVWQ